MTENQERNKDMGKGFTQDEFQQAYNDLREVWLEQLNEYYEIMDDYKYLKDDDMGLKDVIKTKVKLLEYLEQAYTINATAHIQHMVDNLESHDPVPEQPSPEEYARAQEDPLPHPVVPE